MAELDRDGVCIHYDVTGRGPAVLLTHGFSSSSHMFAAAAEALAVDHQVITWDVRGHGRSDSPPDPAAYSSDLAVGDMVALLDAVGVERAVVAGHSLGGYLSLECWVQHPDRVQALILIGTGPGYRNDEARQTWNRMAERYAGDLAERGLAGLPGGDELRADVHRSADGLVLAARGILTQRDGRVMAALATISVPTLVVVGEHDTPFLDASRYMADRIPGAELVVMAEAGHSPNLAQPAAFNDTVCAFLRRVEGVPV